MIYAYRAELRDRILVHAGAMGTTIQGMNPDEHAYGRPEYVGCLDQLTITCPGAVAAVHHRFSKAGADVIVTNTFRANRLALAEYGLEKHVHRLNHRAVELAREASGYKTLIAGSLGPSGFLPSANDPELSAITYQELRAVYKEQALALLDGGVDVLLVETGQDVLEMRAAVAGCREARIQKGQYALPIQAQPTLDTNGRMLLGTDVEAATVILERAGADLIGLNCSTGPEHFFRPMQRMAEITSRPITAIPNAGIPENMDGIPKYLLTPEDMAEQMEEMIESFGLNIIGGCCGTTPAHTKFLKQVAGRHAPRRGRGDGRTRLASAMTATDLCQEPKPTLIGERVNTQGSKRMKEAALAWDLDAIQEIAEEQVEGGAHFLDVCVALTEDDQEQERMIQVVKRLSQAVPLPLMIDSTEPEVTKAALETYPGTAIVNSVHLEDGGLKLQEMAPLLKEHGAAVVALTIDKEGMAKTAERKLAVAKEIHEILSYIYIRDDQIIFDVLTFTLATGQDQDSAKETLEGIALIKEWNPNVSTILGLSNVSFGLPVPARKAINAGFLKLAVEKGLDTAIVNPSHLVPWDELPEEEQERALDLILNRREDALQRILERYADAKQDDAEEQPAFGDPVEKLYWQVLKRKRVGVEETVDQAVDCYGGGHNGAIKTLNEALLPAMKEVGDLFGAGKLILPFVLQSAQTMKVAVARLETYLEKVEGTSKGTVVIATVAGDVHDIGKGLVKVILENNGYRVVDLGKRVPINTIIETAVQEDALVIGLSALLVSTSKQMPLCVQELDRRGLKIPVYCGGAAINREFVERAARVGDHQYAGGVHYCEDSFEALKILEELTSANAK